MNEFLRDYPAGLTEGRYLNAGLPDLPFADSSFDSALCSHFLFLYTRQLGEAFHPPQAGQALDLAYELHWLTNEVSSPQLGQCAPPGSAKSLEAGPPRRISCGSSSISADAS